MATKPSGRRRSAGAAELGRVAGTLVHEHGDEVAPLGVDEDQPLVAEGRDLDALGLDALGLGALHRIVAVAHGQMLEQIARVPEHLAGGSNIGEPAAAALVVALVGGHQAILAQPADRVGLAEPRPACAGAGDHLVVVGIDLLEIDRTGVKWPVTLPEARSIRTTALFSCRVRRHVGRVDVDELGLGVPGAPRRGR